MSGSKSRKHRAREAFLALERFKDNEHAGKGISSRTAALRSVAREDLAEAVFMLFREAKHQTESIRQAIKEAGYAFESGAAGEGDRITFLAGEAAAALRDHAADPQTILQALSQRSPEVDFTVAKQDAVSLLAATIREQRLDGILEGLRLAGVLNEPGKRRPVDMAGAPEGDRKPHQPR